MKNSVPNPPLLACSVSATISTGFTAKTATGKPARLSIIDEAGNVIEAGPSVAWAAWRVCIEAQENFWQGQGHLVVHAGPPTEQQAADKAA